MGRPHAEVTLWKRPAAEAARRLRAADDEHAAQLVEAADVGAPIRADLVMVDAALATEQGARDTVELWEGQDVPGSRAILDEWMRPPK